MLDIVCKGSLEKDIKNIYPQERLCPFYEPANVRDGTIKGLAGQGMNAFNFQFGPVHHCLQNA